MNLRELCDILGGDVRELKVVCAICTAVDGTHAVEITFAPLPTLDAAEYIAEWVKSAIVEKATRDRGNLH